METVAASSVFLTFLCILVLTGLIKVANWVWFRPKKLEKLLRQNGFSGTSYRSLFGDLKEFTFMRRQALKTPMINISDDYFQRVEPFRHQLITKIGKRDYFIWFGPIPMLHISNPELIREMLTKMHEFGKMKVNPYFEKLFPGLASHEGEKWAKHRKVINPAFHTEKLKIMLPAFQHSCEEVISKWELEVAQTGSGELDVWPDIMKLAADAISRAAFGSNYEKGQRVFELIKDQTDLALTLLQTVYFPGLRHIPTASNRRLKNIECELHSLLRTIINKRKEAIEAGEAPKDDLLGILMDSNSKELKQGVGNSKHQHVGMSLDEVIDECKLFYLGGQETTSTLIVWTLILLSKHQDWQERVREEIFQMFGNNVPDYEGLSQLKTANMILHEVLRLYPPGLQLARLVHKNTKLGSVSIPQGAIISFSVQTVHRDPEFWGDDAQEFNPQRFNEGISQATKGHNSFFPFGWGPRICLGKNFAMTEAKMAISMILQRFTFKLSPLYVHAPMATMVLHPQHGAQLILNKL